MIDNPRVKYCYTTHFIDEVNTLLISENDDALLTGRLYSLLLKEIRYQSVPVNELVTRLKDHYNDMEIYFALAHLERDGLITEDTPHLPLEYCAYWNSHGMETGLLQDRLQEKRIRVESTGPPLDIFMRAFEQMDIKIGNSGVLNVVVTDNYEEKELERVNREALKSRQPWMLIKPVGTECWLGPIFIPGETGCWECLKQRLVVNRPVNTFYKTYRNTEENPSLPPNFISPSLQIAANLAGTEIVKWLYFGENKNLEGKLVTFNARSLNSRSHTLFKRPQCNACRDEGYKILPPVPINLKKNVTVNAASSGGYREVSHEDTVEKYQHYVSPITGVVRKVTPYHNILNTPIHNYSSGENMSFRSQSLFWLKSHLRSGTGGKGKSKAQAKAGALCEAMERYCLTYHGDEYYITGKLEGSGSEFIHPNDCQNYSDKQYQNRDEFNKTCSKFFLMTPYPFDPSQTMHWSPLYSLTNHTFKYLPSSFCYAHYPVEDLDKSFAYPDSNGCAAGNSYEEAILQGFLELIERDSAALWWYNMVRRPAVDLASFKDPYFDQLTEYYRSLERSLVVLDLTADLGIPAFVALSHRCKGEKDHIIFGFGAHVNAAIGIERALVELNQILPIVNIPEKQLEAGRYRTEDKIFVNWLDKATLANQPYLKPLENTPLRKATDYQPLCEQNIYDSLIFCLSKTEQQGLESLVLDMTRPDIPLKTVKVVVPGLRHFWMRLAPGRLYDVPVKLGWLKEPLSEEEMNPVGIFI